MKIKAAQIFCDGAFQRNQTISIEAGRIRSIEPATSNDSSDFDFGEDMYVIPGMIDLHIHGARGSDVMDGTNSALQTISETLAEEGVTGFLPTTMTEPLTKIESALHNIKAFKEHDARRGAEVLGIHLEGPFLSPKFMGAQCGDFLLKPDTSLLSRWQRDSGHLIKLLTLAPELPGALELIRTAQGLNITVSIGHTAASFTETEHAADHGASYATHLFNAMTGVHHRTPGAAAAILYDDRITAELIADGQHVVPAMLKLAVKCKGLDKLVLVTDAMRAKCLKNGEYDLGGQQVVVNQGAARLKKNGVLAGSTLQLNGALRNFVDFTGLSLAESIPLVTETPARILKMEQDIGTLAASKKANLVVLSAQLDVLHTFREGYLIYKRS